MDKTEPSDRSVPSHQKVKPSPPILEVARGVATISLGPASSRNAIDVKTAHQWYEALQSADENPDVRVMVLKSQSDVWSVGGDLVAFRDAGDGVSELIRSIGEWINPLVELLHTTSKVTISSVHGAVAGGAVGMMTACDLVVAADDAVVTLGYSKLATVPDAGATWFLTRQLGYRRTLELYLSSRSIEMSEALELGLISHIVPAPELDSATESLAVEISHLSAHATAATKRLLQTALDNSLRDQLREEISVFADMTTERDFNEGLLAFFERRKPGFTAGAQ